MTDQFNCDTASYAEIGARSEQQDRVEVLRGRDTCLLVLADGMGGHEGGALAAQAVIDIAAEQLVEERVEVPEEMLRAIACGAHERINALGTRQGISPHSTCVLLYLTASQAIWAHVGDSRLYRFKNAKFVGRTLDHSVVELMRLQGRITEEEMKSHPDQGRLYEGLGGENPPEIDLGRAASSESDGFLLASDGLWENATVAELESVFKERDLQAAIRNLVNRAKERGGQNCDNIAVAAARKFRLIPCSTISNSRVAALPS